MNGECKVVVEKPWVWMVNIFIAFINPSRIAFFKLCPSFFFAWNTHLTTIMLFSLACHLWPRVFRNISEYERPWLQNSTPISVFHQHIEQFAETGSRPKQSKGSDISVFPSLLSLCPSTCTPSILNRPCSALAAPIIQLPFNPQAKNNPWTVNQCRGVVALDRSAALNGPQGFRWRRTKWAPFHPLLVQIKLKASVRGLACGQVICGLRWEKKKKKGRKYILDSYPRIDRQTNQKCLPLSSAASQSPSCDCLHKLRWNTAEHQSERWACQTFVCTSVQHAPRHYGNAWRTEGCWERDWCISPYKSTSKDTRITQMKKTHV